MGRAQNEGSLWGSNPQFPRSEHAENHQGQPVPESQKKGCGLTYLTSRHIQDPPQQVPEWAVLVQVLWEAKSTGSASLLCAHEGVSGCT